MNLLKENETGQSAMAQHSRNLSTQELESEPNTVEIWAHRSLSQREIKKKKKKEFRASIDYRDLWEKEAWNKRKYLLMIY